MAVGQFHPLTRAEWREWLERNHDTEPAVWVVSWRSATGLPQVSYDDLVEEALCFGWVDSTVRTLDEQRNAQYVARRKKGSPWARTNKERVARLTAAGLMHPSGLRVVDRAKVDGSWTVFDDVEELVVPDDLAAALGAVPGSRETYETFNRSVKKAVLWWVIGAKRPTTRERRIAETVRAAAEGRPPFGE